MCDLSINNDVSEVILSRQRSLQELIEFTESCQKKLSGIFELLGWNQDLNTDSLQEPMEVCPYDPNHRVPRRSLERHKVSCQLSKMGYSREEQAAMYDPSVCYEKANIPSIIIDKPTQRQIILQAKASAPPARVEGFYSQSDYSADPGDVPQNHQRAICDLTVADRLSLYDHVVREASQLKAQTESKDNDDLYVDLVAKLKKGDDSDGPKSHLEVLAEMRDYKRRRQSYRAKNVHITKKSYTEVIREVIDVHSCELARLWQEEEREEEKESVEKVEPESRSSKLSSHRRRSEERRSGSAESRQSCTSSRDDRGNRGGHRRSRDRDRDRDRDRNRSRERDRDRHRERDRESRRKRDSRSPHEKHRKEKKSRKS